MSDVTNFTFGPFVSRFWMLRKHTIMMEKCDLRNDAPFYAWDCITLNVKNKWDIYFIIKNELAMANFLKLLIMKTNTIDGNAGTASLLKAQKHEEISQKCKQQGINNSTKEALMKEEVDAVIHQTVYRKYRVMKVRMKISFMAFLKNQTIIEIWMYAILKTLRYLRHFNQVRVKMILKERDILINSIKSSKFLVNLAQLARCQLKLESDAQGA